MSKPISPEAAGKQLATYGVELFESLKEIKKHYPEQVLELYRAMVKSIASDEPSVVQEVLR